MLLLLFFNDTATTEIYTLSLHDALPIFLHPLVLDRLRAREPVVVVLVHVAHLRAERAQQLAVRLGERPLPRGVDVRVDRKSTRLNSSHANISYAVFCLKKK